MQNEDAIKDLIDVWMNYRSYEAAANAMDTLTAKYLNDIPEWFKTAPEATAGTFYRAIAVDKRLFNEVQTATRRGLSLPNRKYSSWSWDMTAARDFAEEAAKKHKDKVVAVFQKTFPHIFLNITELAKYFSLRRGLWLEKEVVIKINSGDLLFEPENIFEYLQEGKWIRFKVSKLPIDGRFIINERQDTVKDTLKNLLWSRATLGKMTWTEAEKLVQSLGNHSGWRLPTRKELESLVIEPDEMSNADDPNINVQVFPDTKKEPYWTNLTNGTVARTVDFAIGLVSDRKVTEEHCVRAVKDKT